ncbi:asparagine synthetase B family protein [Clostridium perfringens]|uniref:asparagine synthetase B family protein n=1 Tax=Clostridium perfringens TaxID=1502 RepID=UPI002A8D4056|nr:asparagine synthetase B [Clostridium perfringens]
MCGIAGIYRFDNKSVDNSLLKQMSDILSHRGPDNFGIYKKHNYGVIHRLLKIQDLSKNSNQPIESERYIMSYNGEIYNYLELKKNLQDEGMVFISDGDTEVLLACFEKYGIKKTLEFIDGCYAIALYDKKKDQLNLIRDRMGIKPLYYYKNNNKLVFGSEIKAILQDKEIEHYYNIDTVLLSFLCKLWMPQKETLFKDIFMIEPGSIMVIDKKEVKFIKYYEHKYNIKEYLDSEDEIEKQFGEIFKNSIRKKLISKVSVAAFLSGGIDSSLICKEVVDYGKKI